MKKNSIHPVLATVTLLLAIGIVVACTKENNNKEATATETPRSTMKGLTEQKLANELYNVWHKSDSTYRANSTGFLYVCGEEDFETFYEMANITEAQIDSIAAWANRLYVFTAGDISSVITCIPCNTSLEQYGDNVAAMRDVINELKLFNDSDTVPDFMPYIDSCINLCMNNIPPNTTDLDIANCFLNCTLAKERIRMEIHLMAIKADE